MKCGEMINENPLFCLPAETAGQVARLMRREHVGSIPVVTDERARELIGIVSDRDLALKVVGESRDPNRTNVFDVMTSAVIACREDDDVATAVLAMEEHSIRRIPVVNYAGRLVGMISHEDVSSQALPRKPWVHTLWQAA